MISYHTWITLRNLTLTIFNSFILQLQGLVVTLPITNNRETCFIDATQHHPLVL